LHDELEKLIDIKSDLKVLVYYPLPSDQQADLEEIKEVIKISNSTAQSATSL